MMQNINIYQTLASYARNIKRNIQFNFDLIKMEEILKDYPISFVSDLEFYMYNNKMLLGEMVPFLPTAEFVLSEQKYIEELSKHYSIDCNEFVLGSVIAFFTATSKRMPISNDTFIDTPWFYRIATDKPSIHGKKLPIYEPLPFSKKEYAISVNLKSLEVELGKVNKKRNKILYEETDLLRIIQECDQEKRKILMKERVAAPRDNEFLDKTIYIIEKRLSKIQKPRILLDYNIIDFNSKISSIVKEISNIQIERKKQIDIYHKLKKTSNFIGLLKMKLELEKFDIIQEDKTKAMTKHI